MCIFASTILLVRGCIVGHVRCPVHLVTLSCSVLNWISLCYADCTCLFFGVKWLFCCLSYSKESHNFSLQLLTSPAALTYQVCPGILFSFSFFQISMIFKWISLTSGQLLKPDLEKKKSEWHPSFLSRNALFGLLSSVQVFSDALYSCEIWKETESDAIVDFFNLASGT